MIDTSPGQDLRAFLLFCLLGGILALVWAVFRAVRSQTRRGSATGFFLDAGFGVLCAVSVELLALGVYWGEIRAFLLLGAGIGFLLVSWTVGRVVFYILRALLRFLRRYILRPVGRFCCFLLRKIGKLLVAPVLFVKKVCHKPKNCLKSGHHILYNKNNIQDNPKRAYQKQAREACAHARSNRQDQKEKTRAEHPAQGRHRGLLPLHGRRGRQPAGADPQAKGDPRVH